MRLLGVGRHDGCGARNGAGVGGGDFDGDGEILQLVAAGGGRQVRGVHRERGEVERGVRQALFANNQPSDQDAQLLAEDLMVAHEGEWEERREWSVVAVAEVEA